MSHDVCTVHDSVSPFSWLKGFMGDVNHGIVSLYLQNKECKLESVRRFSVFNLHYVIS